MISALRSLSALLIGILLLATSQPAAAALMPNDVSGLALWLRADAGVFSDDAGTTLATTGQTAERWNDQSGLGHTADGLNDPKFVTGAVNGLPVINFSGGVANSESNRFVLQNPTTGVANPITTNPDQWTIFAVFRQDLNDTSNAMLFSHRDSTTELVQASLTGGDTALLQMRGSGNDLIAVEVPGVVNGEFNIAMFQFDTVNDAHAVSVNGPTEVTSTHDFGAETFNADTQRIGTFRAGTNLEGVVVRGAYLNGDIAELLVYDDVALSPAEKNAIGFYLQSKYGLAGGYAGPPAVVPEPSSFVLVALGALVCAFVTSRRRCRT